jgi:chorismate dehydratase
MKIEGKTGAAQKRLRLGVIPYLNVKPLVWGIEKYKDTVEVVTGTPRDLSRSLHNGAVDVAIVPVFEYFRHPDYSIVPSVAIACCGAVRSILFFSKKPLRDVRTILADRSSLTSVNLLRILVKEHFKIAARIKTSSRPLRHTENFKAKDEDAFLIIGDAALRIDTSNFACIHDLGEAWLAFTGLPFVFAVWTVRKSVRLNGFDRCLLKMKMEGLRHLRAIAKKASSELALPEAFCHAYLKNNVRFELRNPEIQGMSLYYKLLVKHKHCPKGAKIRFYRD